MARDYDMKMTVGRTKKEMSKAEFSKGYIDSWFPNICGYAYHAEIVSPRTGRGIMNDIMKKVDWIEDWGKGSPVLHMKDGTELFVQDSNDFPQPTDECD